MEPTPERIAELALDLVRQMSVMTLATSGGEGPWAAPVYHVFYKGGFYFFSSPDSRHSVEALAGGRASAAVHAHADTWQGIRGVQMSGRVEPVRVGLRAAGAIRAYLAKYPFTKEFFKSGESFDLDAFSKRFRVRLYAFIPELVYYSDNQIRFGFREPVDLELLGSP